jgi:hypothetical protein
MPKVIQSTIYLQSRMGHEHPHFRTAINNYTGLISGMGLSQDAIAARVRWALEGEPEKSA